MSVSIVSPEILRWLIEAAHADFTLVDARTEGEYLQGHIPGALWLGWEQWCQPAPAHLGPSLQEPGYWGLLQDSDGELLSTRLSQAGLSNGRSIVIYADGVLSKGREGRIAWMLLYFGAANVQLLDGGLTGWRKAGGTLSTAPSSPEPGHFTVRFQQQRRTVIDELKQYHQGGNMPIMIDTRSRPEYDGHCFDYMPRMGRVPQSVLLPYNSLFNSDGTFIDRDRYYQVLPAEARNGGRLVAYCEVGVRVGTAAILHEFYTGSILPIYDGSMMEWSAQPELPVIEFQR